MAGTISVKGTGRVVAPADTTFVTVRVSGKCERFETAVKELSDATVVLKNAISDAGIDRESVKTSSLDIRQSFRTVYDNEEDRHGRQVPDGFAYSQIVCFEFPNDNAKLSKAVFNITETPVSPNLSFGFRCSDSERYRNEAIALATANAKKQAEIIAVNSGVKLGGLAEASYNVGSDGCGEDRMLLSANRACLNPSGDGFDIDAEDLVFTESVVTVWHIE